MHISILVLLGLLAAAFIAGWLVERNNPNINAVNDLIGKGQAFIDKTGKLIKKPKA